MRRGIYCGTFDPVHQGHIAFALAAKQKCQLDQVVFMPEARPWRKQRVTMLAHRVKLLRLATANLPDCCVVTLSSGRFSIKHTLPELAARFPDDELVLLMGSDVAQGLPNWERIGDLLQRVSFGIGLRATDSAKAIEAAMQQLSQTYGTPVQYQLVTAGYAELSSSQLREANPSGSLTPEVQAYIERHRLYASK